jgi:hypothetical protein
VLMPYALDGFFRNGGTSAYVLRAMNGLVSAAAASRQDPLGIATGTTTPLILDASAPGIWGNGVATEVVDSSDGDDTRYRIKVTYTPPGSTNAETEDWDRLSADPTDENYAVDVLKRSLFIRWHEGTSPEILDVTLHPGNRDTAAVNLTNGTGGDLATPMTDCESILDRVAAVDDAALLVAASDRMLPGHDAAFTNDEFIQFGNIFVDYAQNQRPQQDLFYIGDLPSLTSEINPVSAAVGRAGEMTASNFAGLFWPHLEVADPVGSGRNPSIVIPPSGYVAGLYGRIDGRRGVWKAPAGVEATLGGVRSLEFNVLDHHQDDLNPKGINAVRMIPGAGSVIWGTRTMQPNSEWRYIPVRRTAIFLRKSIYNGIQWAVFEPNNEPLWQSLRATIGAFMETQFRNGAFAGSTSKEAYFVQCDAETTTPIDQAAGIVNILVGFAPLRPAEFVVVKLSQKTAEAA